MIPPPPRQAASCSHDQSLFLIIGGWPRGPPMPGSAIVTIYRPVTCRRWICSWSLNKFDLIWFDLTGNVGNRSFVYRLHDRVHPLWLCVGNGQCAIKGISSQGILFGDIVSGRFCSKGWRLGFKLEVQVGNCCRTVYAAELLPSRCSVLM